MGISIGHNWSCSADDYDRIFKTKEKVVEEKPLPNPNPKRFKVINHIQEGKFLIVLVNYPDCTNYEGNKILMYDGINMYNLLQQGSIDPHFSNNPKKRSPIARFVPTLNGWEMALKLAKTLK
jgi:hypothetical protein